MNDPFDSATKPRKKFHLQTEKKRNENQQRNFDTYSEGRIRFAKVFHKLPAHISFFIARVHLLVVIVKSTDGESEFLWCIYMSITQFQMENETVFMAIIWITFAQSYSEYKHT